MARYAKEISMEMEVFGPLTNIKNVFRTSINEGVILIPQDEKSGAYRMVSGGDFLVVEERGGSLFALSVYSPAELTRDGYEPRG